MLDHSLEQYLENIQKEIQRILKESLYKPIDSQYLYKAAAYLTDNPKAKRARPKLTAHFADLVSLSYSDVIPIGVAAEFVHAASLLHDDVIDAADTRRGKPTVNALHTNTVAVLTGDLLYTLALDILKPLPKEITDSAIEVVKNMTLAAAIEYNARGKVELSMETWQTIATGKTGDLFAWCGSSAAILANRPEYKLNFHQCGMAFGTAFQIADDLKDFFAKQEGKPRYADIRNKNPNLLLLLLAQEDESFKQELHEIYAKENIAEKEIQHVAKKIKNSPVPNLAFDLLEKKIEEGLSALNVIENSNTKNLQKWISSLYGGFTKRRLAQLTLKK
ncbi:MAG: polyprenyl synthetase family protein [Candidatus Hydrogenedentota bacterium]|nr:MAG: polyprenyl synthetase family protein [Candidatus Hydrogenedentota bacterium]